jgi:hypothetical protein
VTQGYVGQVFFLKAEAVCGIQHEDKDNASGGNDVDLPHLPKPYLFQEEPDNDGGQGCHNQAQGKSDLVVKISGAEPSGAIAYEMGHHLPNICAIAMA